MLEEATLTAATALCQASEHTVAITRDVSVPTTVADGKNHS